MSIVSAYIELPPGPRLEVDPNNLSVEGIYVHKGEEGLHVEWRVGTTHPPTPGCT